MLSTNILREAKNLTESDSLNLFSQITFTTIQTPLCQETINTSYVKQGEKGQNMILLHGFDSSIIEFRRLLPLLRENQRVWIVDLLGFGFTERKKTLKYSPDTIKTHLYHFWQKMISAPVIIVGASMGGATAIDFTLTYPEVVDKLILLDSGGLISQPTISKFLFPPLGFLATEFLRNLKVRQSISKTAYYNPSFASEDALRCAALHLLCDNWSYALINFTKSGGYGSFANQLSCLTQETLILWGENDKILGTKSAPQFEEIIPHSKLMWIKNCGHVPHLEQSRVTADFILDFIN